jgi:hypothetical protein
VKALVDDVQQPVILSEVDRESEQRSRKPALREAEGDLRLLF